MSIETLPAGTTVAPHIIHGYTAPTIPESDDLTRMIVEDETARYFHDVGGHRLLSAEEEVDLARKVQRGLEARTRSEAGEYVADLQEILDAAQEARDTIIRHNLRLVVSIAKKYRARSVPLIDLIQEGNIGLITAVERYNPELGFRFSTYASFWIRQNVGRAIANMGRTIRVPVHMHDLSTKVRRTRSSFEMEFGRMPHDEEVAAILDVTVEQIALADISTIQIASLDKPVTEDGESAIGDILPDPESDRVVEHAVSNAINEQIHQSLDGLTAREKKILTLRFGLGGDQPMTLGELADSMEVSRERVRQIEKRALEKLRHDPALKSINFIGVN